MRRWLAVMAMLLWSGSGLAEEPSCQPGDPTARSVIGDLQRITAPEGVQEAWAQPVNGSRQWISVRGQDRANPLLLVVHGGPAGPLTPTAWQYQRPLEEFFTVANYDQRAAGRSYRLDPPADDAPLRIQQYVDDLIDIAQLLRTRYHKDKVVLMAHSWGTVLALQAVMQRPDLFSAYVGIGQVIDMRANETLVYGYALEQARAHGNSEAVAALRALAPYPGDGVPTLERIGTVRRWSRAYGGLAAWREGAPFYVEGSRLSPEYDDADLCAFDAGGQFTITRVLDELMRVDFSGVHALRVPVLMLMGRHDHTTPPAPVEHWLAQLQAPGKRGVWFEHSGHLLPWEEPGKLLLTLVQDVRPLAVRTDVPVP